MLTISFATRTDSTQDPLVENALELAMEFMDLTGLFIAALFFPSLGVNGKFELLTIFRALV